MERGWVYREVLFSDSSSSIILVPTFFLLFCCYLVERLDRLSDDPLMTLDCGGPGTPFTVCHVKGGRPRHELGTCTVALVWTPGDLNTCV